MSVHNIHVGTVPNCMDKEVRTDWLQAAGAFFARKVETCEFEVALGDPECSACADTLWTWCYIAERMI